MPWHEIFIVGSLWFWVLIAAEILVVLILLEWDRGTVATLTFVATLLLLQFLGDVNIFGYVVENPTTVIVGAVAYFALGTGWAIARWWFYVREQRAWYDELRSAFLRFHHLEADSAMPEELQQQWQNCVGLAKRGHRQLSVRPLAARHKSDILRWMSYWPWSCFWTVLKDPVRETFLAIYQQIAEYLQQISDRAFKGVEADLPPQQEANIADSVDPVFADFGIDTSILQRQKPALQPSVKDGVRVG